LESYTRISGGEAYLSSNASKALQHAVTASKKKGDQYVSVEYILLGLLSVQDNISRILKDNGLTTAEVGKAIDELRKGATVDSQSAEESYNALGRYAINLNDMARNGKLDRLLAAMRKSDVYCRSFHGGQKIIRIDR
jgi:ATP-dependent Clp protease ATP-binding subunit ClpB